MGAAATKPRTESLAAFRENRPIEAMLLVTTGRCDPNEKEKEEPLIVWAVVNRWQEVVKALIEKGADVNAPGVGGFNALWYAKRNYVDVEGCRDSGKEMVDILTASGAEDHTVELRTDMTLELVRAFGSCLILKR